MSQVVETIFDVKGMNCASCVAHVEKAVRAVEGVADVRVNLASERAVVKLDSDRATPAAVIAAIGEAGYAGSVASHDHGHDHPHDSADIWFRRAVAGVVLWLPIEVTHWVMRIRMPGMEMGWMDWSAFVTSTIAIIYVGRGFYVSAWHALRRGTSNMDTLIALGATVAWGYSLIVFFGHIAGFWGPPRAIYFMEANGLLALISLGHWLEARARRMAGDAIHQLMNLSPAVALKLDESGTPREIPLADVEKGDRLLVMPGQRVPVDGVVEAGHSAVDESMMTGEPIPQTRTIGDAVVGGTLNTDGRLTVGATRIGAESALAQIVKLVETAQSSKPPVQQLADRIAAVFVPVVLCIAVVTAGGWYIWGSSHGWELARSGAAIANAVCSVLIIACPCALGLALPAALMVGTGMGAKRGILIRDADALQLAERIEFIVLDKTGTVTAGKPAVEKILPADGVAAEELLGIAASVEQFSAHPLAVAVVAKARAQGIKLLEPESFANESGLGVVAKISGQVYLAGSEALLVKNGLSAQSDSPEGTIVHVARQENGRFRRLGAITFSDPIKPDSAQAVALLHRMNLRTVLLSGDTQAAAQAVATAVGIDAVHGGVKPDGKSAFIRSLQEQGKVAMVGDGINDAPALAAADLGIAIGSGSDVAREVGGIVLVGSSLHGVAMAIALSRATMRTIRQNLFLAFFYNVAAIPLAALGLVNPLIAAGAMALSDVSVIGNALRLRRAKIDQKL